MTQPINETILERIQKLMNKAESAEKMGSLAEAEAFMLKVQQLLNEHNLEMHTVQNHVSKKDRKIVEEQLKFGAVKSDGEWEKNLMCVICRNNWCTNFWNDYYQTHTVIGNPENVGVVIYLYKFIQRSLKELSGKGYSDAILNLNEQYALYGGIDFIKVYGGKIKAERVMCRRGILAWRKVWVRNWLLGAVQGIDVKLTLQRQEAAAKNNTMMGLMVQNNDKLQAYMKETQPDLETKDLNQGDQKKQGFIEGYHTGKNLSIYNAIDSETGETTVIKQLN